MMPEVLLPKVLLVDDDADWLRICSKELPQRNYSLQMSTSIELAVRLLSAETFAVLVADICMPGARDLGGFELLDMTKALGLDTRVVMVTAYAGGLKNITDEALTRRGAHNFVEKKAGFEELNDCIVDAIDHWRQRREFRKLLEEERDSFVYKQEVKNDSKPPEPPIWTIEMQKESWESQLAQHRWNLAILEEQAAKFGLAVPLEIVNTIEKEERAISELESKLRGLEGDNS